MSSDSATAPRTLRDALDVLIEQAKDTSINADYRDGLACSATYIEHIVLERGGDRLVELMAKAEDWRYSDEWFGAAFRYLIRRTHWEAQHDPE